MKLICENYCFFAIYILNYMSKFYKHILQDYFVKFWANFKLKFNLNLCLNNTILNIVVAKVVIITKALPHNYN